MRQASALTILVPSSGLRLERWNKALPKLIRISTSIAMMRYLISTRQQYIVSFSPRPFTTLISLALLVVLISLGRWQLHRADEKRALYQSFAAGTDASRAIDARTPPLPRYQHIEASGHYDDSRQVLIVNMFDGEK